MLVQVHRFSNQWGKCDFEAKGKEKTPGFFDPGVGYLVAGNGRGGAESVERSDRQSPAKATAFATAMKKRTAIFAGTAKKKRRALLNPALDIW